MLAFYDRMRRWNVIMWRHKDPIRIHYPMVLCSVALAAITLLGAALAVPERRVEFVLAFASLIVVRWAYAFFLLVYVNRRPFTLDVFWGEPLMEGIKLVSFVSSFFKRSVRWRGQELEVADGGAIEPRRE